MWPIQAHRRRGSREMFRVHEDHLDLEGIVRSIDESVSEILGEDAWYGGVSWDCRRFADL
jgi:hypothetical protein